jgi:hypothetical protein
LLVVVVDWSLSSASRSSSGITGSAI